MTQHMKKIFYCRPDVRAGDRMLLCLDLAHMGSETERGTERCPDEFSGFRDFAGMVARVSKNFAYGMNTGRGEIRLRALAHGPACVSLS